MPLSQDRGRRGDARPKVHRFRSHWVELGQRLRAYRERHALTQAEVAAAVGASAKTTVTQWETGARVPEGVLRERVEALVADHLWPELRATVVADVGTATGTPEGPPRRWMEAVGWYRRASRERAPRTALGPTILAGLEALRGVHTMAALPARYSIGGGAWGCGLPADAVPASASPGALRRAEDAAYGLRWLELGAGLRVDLRRSLVPQLPLRLVRRGAEQAKRQVSVRCLPAYPRPTSAPPVLLRQSGHVH